MAAQDVRDINEAQQHELSADRDRMQVLQAKRRDLMRQLDEARQATQTQAEELEVTYLPRTCYSITTSKQLAAAALTSISLSHAVPATHVYEVQCCLVAGVA